ncbi:hypothetical protein AMECASPLE_039445 [Ameca splendens]|uniref:Uncharacterized protein n=1 Tax=Ameca splendens TaxID=208324 RepID=A0ABV0Z7A5_9TELE
MPRKEDRKRASRAALKLKYLRREFMFAPFILSLKSPQSYTPTRSFIWAMTGPHQRKEAAHLCEPDSFQQHQQKGRICSRHPRPGQHLHTTS